MDLGLLRNKPKPSGGRFRITWVRDLTPAGHVILLACCLLIIFLGWQLYLPLLDNDFSDFDDHTWERDAARRNNLETIFDPLLTTGHEAMDTSYLPVQSLIYHISVNVVGEGGIPIRVIGLWLHFFNACMVLILAFRFTGSIPAAQTAGLLFLLFPRNVSTVGWLCASLAHGLVLFFYLAAFLILQTFLHRRSKWSAWWRLPVGTVLFAGAVLTKELGSTLFAAVVLYDLLIATDLASYWPPKLRVWGAFVLRHGPLAAVVIAAIVIQSLKYETGFVNTKFGGVEFGLRNPIRLIEFLTLLIHWGARWPREVVLWAMGGVAAALMLGAYLARKKHDLLFLLLWLPLVVTPFTISNFRDAHTLGRYVYEASAVFAILLVCLAVRVVRRWPYLAWPVINGAFVLIAVFAMRAESMVR